MATTKRSSSSATANNDDLARRDSSCEIDSAFKVPTTRHKKAWMGGDAEEAEEALQRVSAARRMRTNVSTSNLIGVEGLAGVTFGFDVRDRSQPFSDIADTFVYDR